MHKVSTGIIIATLAICLPITKSIAANGCMETQECPFGEDCMYISRSSIDGTCMNDRHFFWGNYGIANCEACISGYELVKYSVDVPGCGTADYKICQQACTGCSNCTSDTTWSSNGTGKEKLTTRSCSCNTCNSSTSYRCAAGYYGNGTTCTACPTGGTSSAGTTTLGGCCTTSFSDTKGSGIYSPQCCAS